MKNNYQLNPLEFGTHQIICSLLKPNKNILDIGCNDGYLKRLFPLGNFTGVDYSGESLGLAKRNGYQKVIKHDLNDFSKINIDIKFDYLIFADVLEHLLDPQKALSHFVDHNLKDKGKIIVSLPNVAHIVTRLNLLFGRFEYTDSGTLDRTHLHLYTINTSKKLLIESGLSVESIKFSSNRFGWLIQKLPCLGGLLGYNLIFLCKKKSKS